jgi:hypothetical protein
VNGADAVFISDMKVNVMEKSSTSSSVTQIKYFSVSGSTGYLYELEVSRVRGANSEASPHTLSSHLALSHLAVSHFTLKMISPPELAC